MYISYIAAFQNQPTIVYSESDSRSNSYILKLVGAIEINPEPITWSETRNGMGQIVTYIEWLARIAIYHEQSPMFNILYNRLSFCCNVMCEHNLRRIRNSDNNELFKEAYNKQTKPMHTMTNVLNLATYIQANIYANM